MKLVCLNTWGCRIPAVFDYIRDKIPTTDIFCFQELYTGSSDASVRGEPYNSYDLLCAILSEYEAHTVLFADGEPYDQRLPDGVEQVQTTFVKKTISSEPGSGTRLYEASRQWSDYSGRMCVGFLQMCRAGDTWVKNVHGLWQGSIKTDTEAKVAQSQKILDYNSMSENTKSIICGDFNVRPDTESMRMFDARYDNLITQHGVTSTRSNAYPKQERYADYILVSKDVTVQDFFVEKVEVSDHLPLVLEFF